MSEVAKITKGRAEELCLQVITKAKELGAALRELHESCAWIVLGYKNFAELCEARFGHKRDWAMLQIERYQLLLPHSRGGKDGVLPESPTPHIQDKAIKAFRKLSKESRPAVLEGAQTLRPDGVIDEEAVKASARGIAPEEAAQAGWTGDEEKPPKSESADPWGDLLGAIRKIPGLAKAVAETDTGQALIISGVKGLCSQLLRICRAAKPQEICSECDGSGCDYCYGFGFALSARFVKGADEPATSAQLDFLRKLKDPDVDRYALGKPEVARRLDGYLAGRKHAEVRKLTEELGL